MRICCLLSVAALCFFGCTGGPEQKTPSRGPEVILPDRNDFFAPIVNDIVFGSPESLVRSMLSLRDSNALGSERGSELYYAAVGIYRIVYPLLALPQGVNPSVPAGGVFPELFDDVRKGKSPPSEKSDLTLLTRTVSALSLLFSTDRLVLDQANDQREIADRIFPGSLLNLYLAGEYHRRTGDPAGAVPFYEQASGLSGDAYPVLYGLSQAAFGIHDYVKSRETAESLIDRFPAEIRFRIILAKSLFGSGNLEETAKVIESGLVLDTENRDLLILRCRILIRQEKYVAALAIYQRLEPRFPQDRELSQLLGEIYIGQKKYSDALSLYKSLYESGGRSPEIVRGYGLSLLFSGSFENGLSVLEPLLSDPLYTRELTLPIFYYFVEVKNWGKAAEFIEAAGLQMRDDKYLNAAVLTFNGLGDFGKAAEFAYERYRTTGHDQGLFQYLDALSALNRYSDAFALTDSELKTNQSSLIRSRLYLFRSRFFDDKNPKKLENLRQALLENQNSREALVGLSQYFQAIGDPVNAVQYLSQAVLLYPADETLKAKLAELQTGNEGTQ